MLEEYELLNEELEKKNEELVKENERLKEEYIMLQNASDEVEEELQQRIDKAIEYLESYNTDFKNCRFGEAPISLRELGDLLDILKGSEKE